MIVRAVLATICASICTLTACGRQPVSTVQPGNRGSNVSAPLLDSANTPSILLRRIFQPGTIRYIYHGLSTVRSTLGDSIPRIDSTRVTALLTTTFLEPTAGQPLHAVSRVDSLQIVMLPNASGSVPSPVEPHPSMEDTLQIERVTGKVWLARQQTSCSQATRGPFLRGDEVIPVIPQGAVALRSWVDTTVRQLCRGGIALRATQVARYQITQPGIDNDQRVIRVIESEISGTGTQWDQPVEATGHAITFDTLDLTSATQRLQTIRGSSRMEIEFRSSRRIQKFVQIMVTQISIQP